MLWKVKPFFEKVECRKALVEDESKYWAGEPNKVLRVQETRRVCPYNIRQGVL